MKRSVIASSTLNRKSSSKWARRNQTERTATMVPKTAAATSKTKTWMMNKITTKNSALEN